LDITVSKSCCLPEPSEEPATILLKQKHVSALITGFS
jgi:hypothetical protein